MYIHGKDAVSFIRGQKVIIVSGGAGASLPEMGKIVLEKVIYQQGAHKNFGQITEKIRVQLFGFFYLK